MLIQDTENEKTVKFQYRQRKINFIHFIPDDYPLGYFW